MKYLTILSVLLIGLTGCENNEQPKSNTPTPDTNLRQELAALVKTDHEIQQFFHTASDSLPVERRLFLRDSVFRHNGEVTKEIFSTHGFPDTTLVGPEGQHQLWLLVQHSDYDPGFQEEVLKAMEPMVKRGEAKAKDFAYLTDRVRMAKGEKQWYGTQITHLDDMRAVPEPTADSLRINERRAAIGMESVEAYLNGYMAMHFKLNQSFYAEQGLTEPYRYEE